MRISDWSPDVCSSDLELHAWLTAQLAKLSRGHDLAKAINYMLRRWDAFTRFLDDGRICLTNNTAERALRCVPLGRKAWLFCGSDRGGQRAAVLYTLIQTAASRSEEHTSELQSLMRISYAVFCLKKKTI